MEFKRVKKTLTTEGIDPSDINVNDRVYHFKYGNGIVKKKTPYSDVFVIKFDNYKDPITLKGSYVYDLQLENYSKKNIEMEFKNLKSFADFINEGKIERDLRPKIFNESRELKIGQKIKFKHKSSGEILGGKVKSISPAKNSIDNNERYNVIPIDKSWVGSVSFTKNPIYNDEQPFDDIIDENIENIVKDFNIDESMAMQRRISKWSSQTASQHAKIARAIATELKLNREDILIDTFDGKTATYRIKGKGDAISQRKFKVDKKILEMEYQNIKTFEEFIVEKNQIEVIDETIDMNSFRELNLHKQGEYLEDIFNKKKIEIYSVDTEGNDLIFSGPIVDKKIINMMKKIAPDFRYTEIKYEDEPAVKISQ